MQRLAGQLVNRCHGLGHTHVGAICDAITAAGIDPKLWSARAITEALNTDMQTCGWSWPDRVQRPGAFLASRLRRLDWRPCGPPKNGGAAAAGLEEKTAEPPLPVQPLTPAQQARIDAARAEIRAVLAARTTLGTVPHS